MIECDLTIYIPIALACHYYSSTFVMLNIVAGYIKFIHSKYHFKEKKLNSI